MDVVTRFPERKKDWTIAKDSVAIAFITIWWVVLATANHFFFVEIHGFAHGFYLHKGSKRHSFRPQHIDSSYELPEYRWKIKLKFNKIRHPILFIVNISNHYQSPKNVGPHTLWNHGQCITKTSRVVKNAFVFFRSFSSNLWGTESLCATLLSSQKSEHALKLRSITVNLPSQKFSTRWEHLVANFLRKESKVWLTV